MTLDFHLVLMVAGGLLAFAAWLASYRPQPRELGLAAGLGLLALGALLEWQPAGLSGLVVDAVSLPQVGLGGLGLAAVFLVMPKRHLSASTTAALSLLTLAHLGLAMAATPALAAVFWAASCGLSLWVLPAGPARRLALPYVGLAAGAGLAGLLLGGHAGAGLLLLAVALRLGVFPFHTWVVGAYTLAPTTLAVAISAPMSALALVAREPMGFEGDLSLAIAVGLALAAIVTAAMAVVQKELTRGVGFLTVSVQSLVFLGVLDADHIGHLGGLIMWGLTGLALLGLGLVAASLRSRTGGVRIDTWSGLAPQAPQLAVLFLLFGLAAVGAPGTADFASEDLVLHGSFADHPLLLVAMVSGVSAQAYAVMHLFYKAFFGPASATLPRLPEALPRERVALFALGGLILLAGLAPQILVDAWLVNGAETVTAFLQLTP